MAADTPKAEFTESMEARLDELRTRFQEMELEQMKKGEIEARAKLADAKKRFEKKRRDVENRLDTVRRASSNAWEDARDGLESAWGELTDAVERAQKDFEGTLEEEEEKAGQGAD